MYPERLYTLGLVSRDTNLDSRKTGRHKVYGWWSISVCSSCYKVVSHNDREVGDGEVF